jgi:multidrug transporter EmrE-like cation transporter
MACGEEMISTQILSFKPWMPFLFLALIAQQANMLTYKFGGEVALPAAFLVYTFFVQSLVNIVLFFYFWKKGFPPVLKGRMKLWVLCVAAIYVFNEIIFFSTFRAGAPYGLMMAIFAVTSLTLLTCYGLFIIREKISLRQLLGIGLAIVSILLVRLG